jgi:hypothetical protein
LRNIGIVFFSKKNNTIYVADEIVSILRKIKKERILQINTSRRTLMLLREPIINQIAKSIHGIDRKLNSIMKKLKKIIGDRSFFYGFTYYHDIYKARNNSHLKKRSI